MYQLLWAKIDSLLICVFSTLLKASRICISRRMYINTHLEAVISKLISLTITIVVSSILDGCSTVVIVCQTKLSMANYYR